MYTNTAALANDPTVSRLSKSSCGHINRLCSGHQHRRLVLRPDCQRCGFTVGSTAETPVQRLTPLSLQRMIRQYKGHGHRRLAPRSAFNDRLVGVGLLKDSAVIYFWSLPHHTYSDGDRISSHFIIVTNSAGPLIAWRTQSIHIYNYYIHKSCSQIRVLFTITMDATITSFSTNVLTQAVYRAY